MVLLKLRLLILISNHDILISINNMSRLLEGLKVFIYVVTEY